MRGSSLLVGLREMACTPIGTFIYSANSHQVLVALLSAQSTGQRPLHIARWTAQLLRYNFTVQYRCGEQHEVADALSWLPQSDIEGGLEMDEEIVSLVTSAHQEDLLLAT